MPGAGLGLSGPGMASPGMAWHGLAEPSSAQPGAAGDGLARLGSARRNPSLARPSLWHGSARHRVGCSCCPLCLLTLPGPEGEIFQLISLHRSLCSLSTGPAAPWGLFPAWLARGHVVEPGRAWGRGAGDTGRHKQWTGCRHFVSSAPLQGAALGEMFVPSPGLQ